MSGWTDFPLSNEGWRQAALLARKLELERVAFGALYSSPLRRAADTARALSARCPKPIELLDSLREIGCGCVDGMPLPFVQREYAREWQTNLLQRDPDFRWPGGESYRELRDRCIATIQSLAARHEHQRIAIVTHAGVISQIVGYLHALSPARWESFRPGNASINEIEWSAGRGRLIAFDDRDHLASATET